MCRLFLQSVYREVKVRIVWCIILYARFVLLKRLDCNLSAHDYFVSKTNFAVFKCSDCDFHFTQDYPEEAEIAGYYESDDYISHSDTSEGFSNKLYRIARSVMLTKEEKSY